MLIPQMTFIGGIQRKTRLRLLGSIQRAFSLIKSRAYSQVYERLKSKIIRGYEIRGWGFT